MSPDCLLLDEPLSNLDAKLRHDMRGEIKRICKTAGISTIHVTQDQGEAMWAGGAGSSRGRSSAGWACHPAGSM